LDQSLRRIKPFDERNPECSGLAGARLRLTDQIAAVAQQWDNLALNGRRLFPAQPLDGPECFRAKCEVAELGRRLGSSC